MIAPTMGDEFCAQTEAPTHKADSRGRLSLQKNKLRAGRRASDRIQVLLYALRGEKSPIGGICNPSVAPHLHRKFVREVRSEFLWTVDGAAGRSNRRFAHFFFGTFFFCVKKKVHCPPKGEMGVVRGGELREEQAPPLPWGNGDCARRGYIDALMFFFEELCEFGGGGGGFLAEATEEP